MYILYYILAYIQLNGDVSLENVRLLLRSIPVQKRHSTFIWPIRYFMNFTNNNSCILVEMVLFQVHELLIKLLLTVVL